VVKYLAAHAPTLDTSAWLTHFIGHGLSALEQRARESAGSFLVGDTLSMADIFLVPQMGAARRFNVDVTAFPTLVRIDESCGKLEAFARAHPLAQPDAEVVA
jgi:glutathione S-transferase